MSVQIVIDKVLNAFQKISVQDFVEISNFNTKSGFYNLKEKSKIGKNGHFITSPEISSIFGKAILNQFLEKNKNISQVHLVELGPGNGYLTFDILEELLSQNIKILSLTLIEKSDYFKKKLEKFNYINNFQILSDIKEFQHKDDELVFIYSNEFFDTFGHKQFLLENNQFLEIVIRKKENSYCLSKIKSAESDFLKSEYNCSNFLDGDILEYSPLIDYFLKDLKNTIKKFYFTTNDYGYVQYPKKSTLRAIKNKKKISLFDEFESVDYSFSVDFNRLSNNFLPYKTDLISQSSFLKKYVPKYFANDTSHEIKLIKNILSGLEGHEMGNVFKNFTAYNI